MILNTTIALLILNSCAKRAANKSEIRPQMVANNSLVLEVISSLNSLYDFENVVFFVSEQLANDESISVTGFFADFWCAFPAAPITWIVNRPSKMAGFLSSASLCLILTTASDDPIMEVAALSMRGARFIKTIFILHPLTQHSAILDGLGAQNLLNGKIRALYEWVWRKQFLNTVLITASNNIYIHEPYPEANIVNKTANWRATDFFVDYSANFKGYRIRTMLRHDLPRVFLMTRFRSERSTEAISGVAGKIFLAFVSAINATFNATLEDNLNLDTMYIRDLIEQKNLDIGVNSYTAMMPSLLGASYPIGINDWCIMVPYQNRSPERSYVKGAFRPYSWYLLIFSIFYVTLGIWLCTPTRERDLSLAFLQSICSLVLIAPLRFLALPYLRLRFLFLILFVMGFFTTNMYLSKVTSYLTSPTPQKQIDSVQDVIQHKLPIMVTDYEFEKLKMENLPQKFLDLIVVASATDMDQHRDHLNSTYGYSTQTDRWWFVNKQQASLKKPLFRPTSICIGPFYHVFPIQRDSHLAEPLQDFILTAYQYGFMFHWQAEAFLDALFMGYITMIKIELQPVPLTVTYFRPVWLVWWFGIIVAGLSFVLEVKGVTPATIRRAVRKLFAWLRVKLTEL